MNAKLSDSRIIATSGSGITYYLNYFSIFDYELRSIAVLRMSLLLLLGISISQILINDCSFRDWIDNQIFYEIVIKSGVLISSIVEQNY